MHVHGPLIANKPGPAVPRAPSVLACKWDARSGPDCPPFPLRWFCSWTPTQCGRIAGYIAGYEGGNAYMQERFLARLEAGELDSFIWNGMEHIGAEPTPATFPPDPEPVLDAHAACFMAWCDEEAWERDQPSLREAWASYLEPAGASLWMPPYAPSAMGTIAALIRRTGILTRFE